LSITTAPAAATRGAYSREAYFPQLKSAKSSPSKEAVAMSSTTTSWPAKAIVVPADRAEAKKRTLVIGNPRSTRIDRMTEPTWPVAPNIPMFMEPVYSPTRRIPQPGLPAHAGPGKFEQLGGPQSPTPLRPSSYALSSSNARCSVRTASSARSAATMQEIRIGDVEIISMLIPSRASASNIVAVTPGFVFMPAPTTET
jgi:hypothetical protein